MAVLGFARLGSARLGAFRLGYYQPRVRIMINGVDRSGGTFVDGVTITDELNHAPNTASFRCRGFTPVHGQEVKIHLGDTAVSNQLFGGHILNLEQGFEGKPEAPNVYWQVSCIDYTWLLSRRPAIKKYSSQSATAIVLDLIASYTAGFTTANVVTGLASLDEITFTNEDLPDAFTRITERFGGYWYVDYGKDLHVFLTEPQSTLTVGDSSLTTSDVKQAIDLSQVATRVTVRGGGSTTASDVALGATALPVEDSTWYSASGGVVEAGPQRITYTGFGAAAAPSAPTATASATAGPLSGVYTYKTTFVVGTGETAASSASSSVTAGIVTPDGSAVQLQTATGGSILVGTVVQYKFSFINASGETPPGRASGTFTVTSDRGVGVGSTPSPPIGIPTGPAGTTGRNVYRSDNGGPYGRVSNGSTPTINDNTTTGWTDLYSGLLNPPRDNGSQVDVTAIAVGPAGTTARRLYRTASGGSIYLRVTEIAGNVTTVFTDAVPDSSLGDTAPITSTVPDHLTGIPASGAGSILYAINKGEPVNVVVTVNDTAAQTALAALVGGDGIHEMFLTDGRWSITEATARANAELSQRKDPLVTVSLTSRDPNMVSGRNVTITKTNPAISGTFKIQRVTITIDVPTQKVFPIRQVECSSRQYSFEDLLRQIKGKAA